MANKKFRTGIFSCLLTAAVLVSLSACGNGDNEQNTPTSGTQEINQAINQNNPSVAGTQTDGTQINGAETSGAETNGTQENESQESGTAEGGKKNSTDGSRILIAYFTAAENSGVDAISSASYTTINDNAVGRVRAVADMIQEITGGKLFSIQTSTVYPTDGGELIDQAADEQNDNFRPELTSHIDNLDEYEVIFVGYPNWWYDMPMAMYSFFEEYDFSGKTIIPFNVHNGSRFSSTISTIQDLEPDAVVQKNGFTVSERNVADAQEDVQEWLDELEY